LGSGSEAADGGIEGRGGAARTRGFPRVGRKGGGARTRGLPAGKQRCLRRKREAEREHERAERGKGKEEKKKEKWCGERDDGGWNE
jgi:hypothetical protein